MMISSGALRIRYNAVFVPVITEIFSFYDLIPSWLSSAIWFLILLLMPGFYISTLAGISKTKSSFILECILVSIIYTFSLGLILSFFGMLTRTSFILWFCFGLLLFWSASLKWHRLNIFDDSPTLSPLQWLSLSFPILIGLIISLTFEYGWSPYDPWSIYAWRIKLFSSTGTIDFSILAPSQGEAFYSFFVALILATRTETLFWIQFSPILFCIIYGLLILNLCHRMSNSTALFWFAQIFAFGVSFPFLMNATKLWASGLGNIFLLQVCWLLLDHKRVTGEQNVKENIYVSVYSLAALLSHVFSGLLASFLLFSSAVLDSRVPEKEGITSKNYWEIALAVALAVFAFLRVMISLTAFNEYKLLLEKTFLRPEWAFSLICFSISLYWLWQKRKPMNLIAERKIAKMENLVLFRIIPVVLLFILLIILTIPDLQNRLELIMLGISPGGERFSFSPVLVKLPLLFYIALVTAWVLISVFKNVVLIELNHRNSVSVLIFSLLGITGLSYILNFLRLTEVYYLLRISAIFLPILTIGAIAFLEDKKLSLGESQCKYLITFVLMSSVIFSAIAVPIGIPFFRQASLVEEEDIQVSEMAIDWAGENTSIFICNSIPLFVSLNWVNNGTRGNMYEHPNTRNFVYFVSNFSKLVASRNFEQYDIYPESINASEIFFLVETQEDLTLFFDEYELNLIKSVSKIYFFSMELATSRLQ